MSILTERDALTIRERYASDTPDIVALAREFDVSYDCIRYIIKGETWQHVGGPIGYRGRPGNPPPLTDVDYINILAMRAAGLDRPMISEITGLNKAQVLWVLNPQNKRREKIQSAR